MQHSMRIYRSGATKRNHSSRAKSWHLPSMPSWGSFFLGVLSGILVTSLIYFKFATNEVTLQLPNSKSMQETLEPTPPDLAAQQAPAKQPAQQAPQFDFYRELTKNEEQPANKAKVLDLKSAPKAINGYLVQAGSFKQRADADTLKATLALNGIGANIESAKLSDGNIWYRVLVGPYNTASAAKAQQKTLKPFARDSIIVHRYVN